MIPSSRIFAIVYFQKNKSKKKDAQLSSLKVFNVRLKNECNDFKEGEKEQKLRSSSAMVNDIKHL